MPGQHTQDYHAGCGGHVPSPKPVGAQTKHEINEGDLESKKAESMARAIDPAKEFRSTEK